MKLISVIAPMYNEEATIHTYCQEMLKVTEMVADKYAFEILLVNDGSTDRTYEAMIEEHCLHTKEITVVCLTRNFGLEGAVSAGLKKAGGDAVIVMDADLQDPPLLILEMIKKWEQGTDVVIGSRIKRSSDNFFKRFGAGLYYKILNFLSGKIKLERNAANFRLLSRKACDQVLSLPEVNSVFRVVVPFVGMKTEVVEYDRDKRYAGKTKYNLRSMIPYALDSITGISVEPLRKIMSLQLLTMVLFVAAIIGMIVCSGDWRRIWFIFFVLDILLEAVFFSLAVMAEYIAQIMTEVKGRPISIIYEYMPCDNVKEGEEG